MPTTWPVFSWSSLRESLASSLCMILSALGPKIFQRPSTWTAGVSVLAVGGRRAAAVASVVVMPGPLGLRLSPGG